ncbi:hypothetical protein GCM10022251_52850 [Phytohabitans flavus]
MRRIAILDAPSNLGLRPPTETSVPGCAKAPGALRDHDLVARLAARDAGCLTPPRYDPGDWRPGDGVCHAEQIAAYSVALADRIGSIIDAGEFPVVLGGDCSVLLGSAIAMHRQGEVVGGRIGLVFVDGHSDFRHPGNASYVGAAAGEDLALATGRGQADLAGIEGRRPYFRDVDVVVLGIRAQDEYRLDLQAAGIITRPVPALRVEGAARSAQWARDQLSDCAGYWVHVDVDVLDPAVMPAVDAPDPGGIAFAELELLLSGLVDTPRCLGVEITVFDPDYDPDGSYAAEIVETLVAGLAPVRMVEPPPVLPPSTVVPPPAAVVELPPAPDGWASEAPDSAPAWPAPAVEAVPEPSPPPDDEPSWTPERASPDGAPSWMVPTVGAMSEPGGAPVWAEPAVEAVSEPAPAADEPEPTPAADEPEAEPATPGLVAPSARKPLDAETDIGMAAATTSGALMASGSVARTASGPAGTSSAATSDGAARPPVLGDSAAAEVMAAAAAAAGIRMPPAARRAPDDDPQARLATTTGPADSAPAQEEERQEQEKLGGREAREEEPAGPEMPAQEPTPRRKLGRDSSGRWKAEPDSVLRRKAESAWMDVAADLAARRGTPAERAARRVAAEDQAGLRPSADTGPAKLRRGGEAEPAWKDDEPKPPAPDGGKAEPPASDEADPAAAEEGSDARGSADGPGERRGKGSMPVPAFEPFGPPAKAGPGRLRRNKKGPPPAEIA